MPNLKKVFSIKFQTVAKVWAVVIVFLLLQGFVHWLNLLAETDPGEVVYEASLGAYAEPEIIYYGEDRAKKRVGLRVVTSDSTSVVFYHDEILWAAMQDSLDGWVVKRTDTGKHSFVHPD